MTTVDLDSRFLEANRESGVLRVRLNRLERRNACTMEMYNGIKKAMVIADNDPDTDVVVITGTGDSFCVGGDMGGQAQETDGRLAQEADPLDMVPFTHLERCTKTVITMINGLCHGGGLNLALCSDISIASDRAQFRGPELLRGLADGWLGARLPQRIGFAKAKYMIFTAAAIDAVEAERMGLVSLVVPHEELEEKVKETIEQIRLTGPEARAALKKQINQQLPPFDVEIFTRSMRSPEMIEGFSAFLERRAPRWR